VSEVPAYRLVRDPVPPVVAPVLDDDQAAVVAHPGGPLLVLAGPGTGKTTTLVEAVVERVRRGLDPEQVLVLTFSRKAANELRTRITTRLARTLSSPSAWTFHSFCYALLRAERPAEAGNRPLRLLSGPEQELQVRELLLGSAELGTVSWPPELQAALRTRGLSEEVRSLLSRARGVALDPAGLATAARAAGREDWWAVARFFAEYLDVLDAREAVDYGELVHQAVVLAEQPEVRARLRARFPVVFVDEFQDTDPAQEALLRALAGDGRDLVVVGDPDQAIYGFRGAEVRGLLDFPSRFPTRSGQAAPVLTLRRSRRAGAALLAASRSVAQLVPLSGLDARAARLHRALHPAPDLPAGQLEVVTYPSQGAEAEAIADVLRRAHLADGLPWSSMAVLVRSGVRSIPLLRRVLSAAGVPLEVAGDELPLAREPAVAPLLLALRCADKADELTPERVRALLLSPLSATTPSQLRRLGRALRAQERERLEQTGAGGGGGLPRPSSELLREAVAAPSAGAAALPRSVGAPALDLSRLLAKAAAVLADDGSPELALWEIWAGSSWPQRLLEASRGAGASARAAGRDLDAVVALFAAVARASEQRARPGVRALLDELEAQQIPGDTLSEQAVRDDAVRLLTAHRSKGLEWDLVVVAGVQEGSWPDLRSRGSLLQPDRLAPDGQRPPLTPAELLVEERRLFYVAATRARRRLVVTAVADAQDDGERPSRFLSELGVPVRAELARVPRPLSLPAMVAALRKALVDPELSPGLRRGAAQRLARLAAATDPLGTPVAPAAHPDRWWGVLPLSPSLQPLRPEEEPLKLSGSSLTALKQCPLQWFFGREVHADSANSTAMGFGSVLHALAEEVASRRTPAQLEAVMQRLDTVWNQLAYEARWQSAQQRGQAEKALQRFLRWHVADRGRTYLGSEVSFEIQLDLPSGPVLLRGSMDRVELDADGRVRVIDFKTGKKPETPLALDTHPQLGIYQLAVREGAVAELAPGAAPGGAELVQLRADQGAKGQGQPKVQPQPALAPGEPLTWIEVMLDEGARQVRYEQFPPRPGDHCRSCPYLFACPAQPEGRQVVA